MEYEDDHEPCPFEQDARERSPRSRTPSPEPEPMDNETLEATQPQFYHFKIKHDPSFDYKEICKAFFMEEHPYLCTIEHVNQVGVHVHCQGTSKLAPRTVKNRLNTIAKKHYLRKLEPGCRPTSMSARPVDVMGFQYMAKEVKPAYVLAVNKFSWDDLKELKVKSQMHVKEIKTVVTDFIRALTAKQIKEFHDGQFPTGPIKNVQELIERVSIYIYGCHRRGEITLPKYNPHHTRRSIIQGLLDNPNTPHSICGKLYCL